jgi:hypothetical protein
MYTRVLTLSFESAASQEDDNLCYVDSFSLLYILLHQLVQESVNNQFDVQVTMELKDRKLRSQFTLSSLFIFSFQFSVPPPFQGYLESVLQLLALLSVSDTKNRDR